jgi:hypothetical protein
VHTPAAPPGKEPAAQEAPETGAAVLPAAQAVHVPEQAAVVRPALLPKVPAGQSKQAKAPASE